MRHRFINNLEETHNYTKIHKSPLTCRSLRIFLIRSKAIVNPSSVVGKSFRGKDNGANLFLLVVPLIDIE